MLKFEDGGGVLSALLRSPNMRRKCGGRQNVVSFHFVAGLSLACGLLSGPLPTTDDGLQPLRFAGPDARLPNPMHLLRPSCTLRGGGSPNKKDTGSAKSRLVPVLFQYPNPESSGESAHSISVVGSWNSWSVMHALEKTEAGDYQVKLMLPPGNFDYKIVKDGKILDSDPKSPDASDGVRRRNQVSLSGSPLSEIRTEGVYKKLLALSSRATELTSTLGELTSPQRLNSSSPLPTRTSGEQGAAGIPSVAFQKEVAGSHGTTKPKIEDLGWDRMLSWAGTSYRNTMSNKLFLRVAVGALFSTIVLSLMYLSLRRETAERFFLFVHGEARALQGRFKHILVAIQERWMRIATKAVRPNNVEDGKGRLGTRSSANSLREESRSIGNRLWQSSEAQSRWSGTQDQLSGGDRHPPAAPTPPRSQQQPWSAQPAAGSSPTTKTMSAPQNAESAAFSGGQDGTGGVERETAGGVESSDGTVLDAMKRLASELEANPLSDLFGTFTSAN